MNDMPQLGDIKKGKALGYKRAGGSRYIWHACIECGKERWVHYIKGEARSKHCNLCGRQQGKNIYSPKQNSVCKKCGIEYPATSQYFMISKHTRSNLIFGVCKQCRYKLQSNWRRGQPKERLLASLRAQINKSLNRHKNGRHWEFLVGYTLKDLMKHISRQFTEGMSWDNYGKWHIDHIIPISAFNFEKPNDSDFKRCWELSNLQPLWAKDNLIKSDFIAEGFQHSLVMAG